MRVAYVIVDWRTQRAALRAHDSIRGTCPAAPVTVVDAYHQGELGYGEACNVGWRRLQALPYAPEVICFCNADVEMLEPDDRIRAAFRHDPWLGIVGPRQLDGADLIAHGGIVPHEDGTEWDLDLRHRCWLWPQVRAGDLTREVMEVPMVPGSILYIRHELLTLLGGWPEWTRFYYEDAWLCFAARFLSWRVLYHGEVTWRHYGQGSPVPPGWREERMAEARAAFLAHCRAVGIPVREWPEEDPARLAQEAGA